MRRVMIVLAATTALTAAAAAQDRGEFGRGQMRDQFARGDFGGGRGMGGGMGMMGRFSPEDIEAFTDARIAALHAGLRLSPDQQQMWPPVEQAIRDLVKLRREQFRAWRERREQGGDPRDDLPGMLRGMAERQAVRAEALRKLAEAATPLYASFDDGQKRRLRMLVRHMRPGGGMMRQAWRGMDGGDMDRGGMGRGDMDRGGMDRGDRDRDDMGDRWRGRGGMGERGFGFGERGFDRRP
jgi:zinc resistance-associated protein